MEPRFSICLCRNRFFTCIFVRQPEGAPETSRLLEEFVMTLRPSYPLFPVTYKEEHEMDILWDTRA